jgi:hypothetical protein
VVVGADGAERLLDAALDADERAALAAAAVPYDSAGRGRSSERTNP